MKSINYYYFALLFNPAIYSYDNANVIYKNDIPNENISHNSGSNNPVPFPF